MREGLRRLLGQQQPDMPLHVEVIQPAAPFASEQAGEVREPVRPRRDIQRGEA
jgi:hypothetical protein